MDPYNSIYELMEVDKSKQKFGKSAHGTRHCCIVTLLFHKHVCVLKIFACNKHGRSRFD